MTVKVGINGFGRIGRAVARIINTIAIIDKATGSIVWRNGPEEGHLTWGAHWPYMIEQGWGASS